MAAVLILRPLTNKGQKQNDWLFERAEGWIEGIPEFGEEDREERRRNICKNAFAYDKAAKL